MADGLAAVKAHALANGQQPLPKLNITPSPAGQPPDTHVFDAQPANTRSPFGDITHLLGWGTTHSVLDLLSGGKKPPVPPTNTDAAAVAAAAQGKDTSAPPLAPGATMPGTDAQRQAFIQSLVSQITGSGANSQVGYTPVQAQAVGFTPATTTLLADPFGKNGYQPHTGDINQLTQNIGQMENHDYLGAFLPDAIKSAAQIYGPQIAAQLLSAAQQAHTIQGYNQGTDQLLSQVPQQIGQDYGNSIALQHTLDQGIQQSLAGLNPNNANLLPSSAPQAQVQAINAQNQQGFNGAGAVLGGLGDLNASSLAAQRASAMQAARELPFLNDLSGRQALVANQIGNNSALAKIQTAEGQSAMKLAQDQQGELGKRISRDISLRGQLSNADLRALGIETGVSEKNAAALNSTAKTNAAGQLTADKTNASNALTVNKTNAGNAIAAENATTSRISATTSRINAGLAIAKAMYPTASASQQASLSKEAESYFGRTSGLNPRLASLPTPDPNHPGQFLTTGNNSIAKTNQAVGKADYETAVKGWAARHGNTPDALAQAQQLANNYYNYGQGDRPFDVPMQEVLQSAGLPTSFFHNASTGPFVTTQQAVALGNAGYKNFIGSLVATPISKDDAVNAGLITKEQADAAQGKTYTIWTIPPVK